ncbi:MAG TPA: 3-methyl-2-oxobutanoate hydroxymethyltransferase [Tepidisphaeraceae bacterium]|jgi:3-methyl-2-oxobutanoate hydroxymethyltransferase|nr:3-methyl-2-oxobutanoate hydroxymethyltransferase [Tepidisphaeraceae bacterium]
MPPLERPFTLSDLRAARQSGEKLAMLTCYDYTNARLMQRAGVPMLLVGDSAANVILGHSTTLPIGLDFMIQLTAAVRRGAPLAMVIADMPFGSYHASTAQGVKNVCKMVKLSGCDCVKLETGPAHLPLVRRLADAGVAVMVHLGLRPQTIGMLGGYRYQARTANGADELIMSAREAEDHGAAALLLEAVPPEASAAVVKETSLPVIGCGAGPACHGHVVVTQDALGLTDRPPRFVPHLANLADPAITAFTEYARQVREQEYPARQHQYEMPAEEREEFFRRHGPRPSERA